MIDLTNKGVETLLAAINLIVNGQAKRVELGHDTIIYKIPSNNPSKFTIRIDTKVNTELLQ